VLVRRRPPWIRGGVTADTREDPERAECDPDTLHPALSNTFDTPIPFARSSISFLEEREIIY